jgi:hypothetical protein
MSTDNTVKIGTVYTFDVTFSHPISGHASDADTTPRYWVFRDAATTGVTPALAGAFLTFRTGFAGHYYGSFTAGTGNNFATGSYYNILVSGAVANITRYQAVRTFYVESNSLDDIANINADTYFADINYNMDDINLRDEFTVCWYKNGAPYSGFTSPTIQIINRSDGSDFLASTSMSGIGSPVLAARYNTTSTSQRLLEGDAYLIVTTASIDSATRTWYRLVSRDARIS